MSHGKSLLAFICWAVLTLGVANAAGAQELGEKARKIGENVREACAKDMKTFCSQVTPGDGRMVACFYAHEDKISVGCDMAILEAGDKLAWFVDEVRTAVAGCAADIREYCRGMTPGEGRIFQCLRDNQGELSQGCRGLVSRLASRLAAR
ncbi:cysteine rich repeat-containing protein [Dichotomicrobium thermohalophilum]|uniref:Cysteine rich repeat-containing protein n=1 Tax=Dichotomicrobium thermohalophilum TaxID=933063 RepID=A0A397PFQ1_9HYPH|nr:cysteine rich repeat-containing protein [Dichotomicrobium thermohalophilum]RIA47788.1 Cysteine rich repeat-containing protein [Dichotomicrobium thermohalophilum]